VLAEQVEGGIVVLADDDRGDLFSLWQHGHIRAGAARLSPLSLTEDAGKSGKFRPQP
jgi:hypothetical protein